MARKKKFVPLAKMAPGAARDRRVARLVANPGTRSKVPTSLLPSKYRAARATAQRIKTENATLYNPAAILSGDALRKSVKAEVDLELNPQIAAANRGISSLIGQRDETLRRSADYDAQYTAAAQTGAANLGASANQLVTQIAARNKSTSDELKSMQDQMNSRAGQQGVQGMVNADPAAANLVYDRERALSAGNAQSGLNAASAQGQGFAGLAGTIAAVAPMRASDNRSILAGQFNKQLTEFYGKRADLEAQRGPMTTSTLNKMRDTQFTNLATAKTLDLKEADLAADVQQNKTAAAQKRADRRARASENEKNRQLRRDIANMTDARFQKTYGVSKQKAAEQARHNRAMEAKGAGKDKEGKRSLTQNQINSKVGDFDRISSTVRANKADGRHKLARELIANNPKVDPLLVTASLDMEFDGHISRKTARMLHKRGLKVSDIGAVSYSEWNKRGRRGKRTTTPPSGAAQIPFIGGN